MGLIAGRYWIFSQAPRTRTTIPEFEDLDDQETAILTANWGMEYISRRHGSHAGEYCFMDEFYELPGLAAFLQSNVEPQ